MGLRLKRPELMLLDVIIRAGGMVLGAAKKYLDIKRAEFEADSKQDKDTSDPVSPQ